MFRMQFFKLSLLIFIYFQYFYNEEKNLHVLKENNTNIRIYSLEYKFLLGMNLYNSMSKKLWIVYTLTDMHALLYLAFLKALRSYWNLNY